MSALADETLTVGEIAALAAEAHHEFPQYADHWSGPEWYRVRFLSQVVTKMGVAFEPGDVTIAHDPMYADPMDRHFVAYSRRTHIDTAVWSSSFERI